MASTYTWAQAISFTAPFVKSIPTSTLDVLACDQTNNAIWTAFPWNWATFSLTSSTSQLELVDGTQDYSVGTTTAGGFFQLLRVRITRTDVTPNISRDKDILQWLAPNIEQKGSIDTIQAVAAIGQNLTTILRLDCAAATTTGTTYQLDGEYWAQPVKVTSTGTTIVFPDQYFGVVLEGLKWRYYSLGDDKRAGTMSVNSDGQKVYTGQWGIFMAALQDMVDSQDYADGFQNRFPESTLGAGGPGNAGLFGWM